MANDFSGINNMPTDYVRDWTSAAESYMQEKTNISINDAKSIFDKLGIEISMDILKQAEEFDGKKGLSRNEFASLFALLDGKLGADNKFHFDGYVEDKSEAPYYQPELNIANQGTENEINTVIGKFHEIGNVNNVHPDIKDIAITLMNFKYDYGRTQDAINYIKQHGWENNSANIIKDRDGKTIGRIIVCYYEAEPNSRAVSNFNYRLEAFDQS